MKRNRESKCRAKLFAEMHASKKEQQAIDSAARRKGLSYHRVLRNWRAYGNLSVAFAVETEGELLQAADAMSRCITQPHLTLDSLCEAVRGVIARFAAAELGL